ncbi:hypothetical protein HC031_08530 [Planosporangium thailandense]|uniref:Uncharacterized protein n=1 Tax=Planosporangium thailandense TaxID=765197 RepID=A0ABX0XUS2_9ACTN|nr:hypothetical protein [Planosporangium thailandense]NJC69765.1 hypothetical protein [Planosporangium thailandense]
MTEASPSRLVIERVDKLSSRPWPLVTGRLEGKRLTVGQRVIIRQHDSVETPATIKGIELHTAPGMTTVAIDVPHEQIEIGSVLTAP